ncbi:putative LRP chaperone MESD [Helianthus anomalus]
MAVNSRSETVKLAAALFLSASFRLLFFLLLIVAGNSGVYGTKKRVHIPDDLHDVEDNEEDASWIEWGQKRKMTEKEFDPPPENFSDLDITQMQEEILKRQVGQSYGFVKLRLSDSRTPDMVSDIAEKWTKLARTGAIEVTFMGFDITTVMFSLQNAQNTLEVKEFLLSQSEAYEIKMGDQFFRRPGDPPYDDLLKELYKGKKKQAPLSNDTILKTEL